MKHELEQIPKIAPTKVKISRICKKKHFLGHPV